MTRLVPRNFRPANPSGFTLLELLVVLVIIGLLAGLVGPQLFGRVDASKVQTADAQVRMLRTAVQTFRLDVGRFPTAEEGLDVLNNPPADARAQTRWQGPYLDESVPLDPWDNAYRYSLPGRNGQRFALYSLGADGEPGGEHFDADIGFLPPDGN